MQHRNSEPNDVEEIQESNSTIGSESEFQTEHDDDESSEEYVNSNPPES